MSVAVFCTDDPDRVVQIPLDLVKLSGMLRNMIEDVGDWDSTSASFPLHNVRHETLLNVIQCWEHARTKTLPAAEPAKDEDKDERSAMDDPAAEPAKNKDKDERYAMDDWEKAFLGKLEPPQLLELILAANYLDAKDLLHMTCTAVADALAGKTPEEIRKLYNIVNDFTPEEEEQIRRENEWAMD